MGTSFQSRTLGDRAVIASQLAAVMKFFIFLNRLNQLAVQSSAKIENQKTLRPAS